MTRGQVCDATRHVSTWSALLFRMLHLTMRRAYEYTIESENAEYAQNRQKFEHWDSVGLRRRDTAMIDEFSTDEH